MLRVGPDIIDDVVHNLVQFSTGMQEEQLAVPVGTLGKPLMPGKEQAANILGTDEQRCLEPKVIGPVDGAHAIVLAQMLHKRKPKAANFLTQFFDKLGPFKEGIAHRLKTHEIPDEFKEMDGVHNTHTLGNVLLVPVELREVHATNLRPVVLLDVSWLLDRPAVFVNPLVAVY